MTEGGSRGAPRAFVGAALVGAAWVVSGCGASGNDWVAESAVQTRDKAPVDASVAEVAAVQEQASRQSENGLPVASRDAENTELPVITLGESYAERSPAETDEGMSDVSSGAGTPVQINNYYGGSGYDSSYYYYPYPAYYWGAGYHRDELSGRPGSPRSSAKPVEPGQSWPAVPNYGPAFPYRTAPASPWEPAR